MSADIEFAKNLFIEAVNKVLTASSSVSDVLQKIFSSLAKYDDENEGTVFESEEAKRFYDEVSDFEDRLLNLIGSLPEEYFE